MLRQRTLFFFIPFLLLLISVKGAASAVMIVQDRIDIPFGTGSALVFDVKTRTYNVLVGQKRIISNAYSIIKTNEQTISSKDYELVKSQSSAINDGFGTGKKYTITMTKTGLPQMDLIFYVYQGHDYFFYGGHIERK